MFHCSEQIDEEEVESLTIRIRRISDSKKLQMVRGGEKKGVFLYRE